MRNARKRRAKRLARRNRRLLMKWTWPKACDIKRGFRVEDICKLFNVPPHLLQPHDVETFRRLHMNEWHA